MPFKFIYSRHLHRNIEIIMQPPSSAKIAKAIAVLNQQELAACQRLYNAGLTSPGPRSARTPFRVQRSLAFPSCLAVIPTGHPEYAFLVRSPEEIEQVVTKAELLFAALSENREKPHRDACCPLATVSAEDDTVIHFTCLVHQSSYAPRTIFYQPPQREGGTLDGRSLTS